jgi:hypothetical protein
MKQKLPAAPTATREMAPAAELFGARFGGRHQRQRVRMWEAGFIERAAETGTTEPRSFLTGRCCYDH